MIYDVERQVSACSSLTFKDCLWSEPAFEGGK